MAEFIILGICLLGVVAIMEIIKSFWVNMPRWFKVLVPMVLGCIPGFLFPFSFILKAGYGWLEAAIFTSIIFGSFASYTYQALKNVVIGTLQDFLKNVLKRGSGSTDTPIVPAVTTPPVTPVRSPATTSATPSIPINTGVESSDN